MVGFFSSKALPGSIRACRTCWHHLRSTSVQQYRRRAACSTSPANCQKAHLKEGSDPGLQKLQRLQNDCRTDCKTQLTKSLHLPFLLKQAQGAWHGAQHDRKRSSQQLAPFMQTDMGRVTPIIFFAFALKASVVFLAGITQCKAQGLRHR